jgi:signal transduction histidine kinase/ligand-binding sensor domain-containing protein/DNA-binding response OmpR family regulator
MGRYLLKNTIWFTGLLLFIMVNKLNAQNIGIHFTHYNIQNGLIQNQVEYILIDSEGFVWLGTYAGLQRFDGFSFVTYTYNPDDNTTISDNFISTIYEDQTGNLWIGTQSQGLNMFNKELETVHRFRHQKDVYNTLSSNYLPRGQKVITQDRNGYLWINTEDGLNKIDISNMTVERYVGDFTGQILYDESEHALWIAADRLKKFNIQTKKLQYYDINFKSLPRNNEINSFIMDDEGLIWMGTNAGLVVFDKKTERIFQFSEYLKLRGTELKEYPFWFFDPIKCMYQDYEGFIWLASGNTLYRLNRTNGTYESYSHEPDNYNSLLDGSISGIYGNRNGVLFISYLNMGISKINIRLKKFTHYKHIPGDPNSLSGNTIRSVYKDIDGNLWIGTYNNGLNRIELNRNRIITYKHNPLKDNTICSDYITAIHIDKDKRLWIGSQNEGLCFSDDINDPEFLSFNRVNLKDRLEIHEFTEDSAGRIWISTQYGFYVYKRKEDQYIHYGSLENQLPELQEINIQSVDIQPPNIFWLATWNRGVCKLFLNSDSILTPSIKRDSLVIYDKIYDKYHSLIDSRFINIFRDDRNVLWLGSYVNGLIKMVEKDGRAEFTKYDRSRGASDNSVYGMAGDDNGNIWISTNHGLGKFSSGSEQFKNYYQSDGLQSNSFIWKAFYQDDDGQIFFGGINGLNAFYPDSIIDNQDLPKVYISKLIIHNKEVGIGDEINGKQILDRNIMYTDMIKLSHNESVFSLEFIAMDNINPEENLYAYYLEGFDESWNFTTAEKRYVNYTNLKPGTYHFMVKASNCDGIWNEVPTVLTIDILPPWWKTWWAIIAYSFLFVLSLLAFRKLILMRARLIHEARLEQMRREKVEELNQNKLRFFTNISHEFRTPLTLILGPLQKLISEIGNDNRFKKQIRLINRNTDRLFRLIDQVIEFRKIETNKIKLHAGKDDIVRFIRELTYSFEEIACQRSIILDFYTTIKSYELWFDEDKMDKIIYNLLSNAFKFTPDKGHISVGVSLESYNDHDDEGGGKCEREDYIKIMVKDSGIGISAEHIPYIFDRYYMVESPDSYIQSGSGIGLALAKELTELHGGKIKVESMMGQGSCFIILFPVSKDHLSENQIIEKQKSVGIKPGIDQDLIMQVAPNHEDVYFPDLEEHYPSEKRHHILIVEDDLDVIDFLRTNLDMKYHLTETRNGKEGLEIASHNNPDLIIADILMPVMDGIEMLKKLKSNIDTSHIPVILLTAKAATEDRISGLETGADAYISKPFSVQLLDAQIRNIFENRKILREKFSEEIIVQPHEIAVTPLDAKFIRKAMDVFEEHISDSDYTTDSFSRDLSMSRSQLHRKLKVLTSHSATEFFRIIRLKRAARLIEESQLSVEEISYSVGFNSPAYFSKCFKIHFGMTPSDYEKNMQKNV